MGSPIRTPPGHRLLRISPRRFAATLRPSSLHSAKASTIHPYVFLLRIITINKSAVVFLPQKTDFFCFLIFSCQSAFKKNRLGGGIVLFGQTKIQTARTATPRLCFWIYITQGLLYAGMEPVSTPFGSLFHHLSDGTIFA